MSIIELTKVLLNSCKFYFLSFQIDSKNIKTFSDLPLSEETKKGLAECEYEVPTEIQKETLTLGLRGLDILGKIKSNIPQIQIAMYAVLHSPI